MVFQKKYGTICKGNEMEVWKILIQNHEQIFI